MDVESETDEISKLLIRYPTLTLTNEGKVKCALTGHEMPLKPDIIQFYVGSRRYARLLDQHTSPYYQKYKQFFVDCNSKKRNRNQVYCTLTKHFVNRTDQHIRSHVQGVNFRDAHKRWMRNPWPLDGASTSVSAENTEATSPMDADTTKASPVNMDSTSAEVHGNATAAAVDDDDDDADIDDIISQTHHFKPEPDDVKDSDNDSCSDLYPEADFIEMETGASALDLEQESKNPLKRPGKQKKPKVLKDLKAKMRRTEDD